MYIREHTNSKVSSVNDGKVSGHKNQNDNRAEEVLFLLIEKPEIKTKEIQEALGWTSNQVKYNIKKFN